MNIVATLRTVRFPRQCEPEDTDIEIRVEGVVTEVNRVSFLQVHPQKYNVNSHFLT